ERAYEAYKATRPEPDPDLLSQIPVAKEVVSALSLARFEQAGYEADDLIAELSRQAAARGHQVLIVTSDKDALQLISDQVRVFNEPKGIVYDREAVRKRYGVEPKELVDMFALMGDVSDNVPGVPGIGEKTAIKLIQQYGSLEEVLAHTQEIDGKVGEALRTHEREAQLSRRLITLAGSVPLDLSWERCQVREPNFPVLTFLLQRLEFLSLLAELLPVQKDPNISVGGRPLRYHTVSSSQELEAWTERWARAERLAVDTETTSLDPHGADLVGIALAMEPFEAVYLPVGHQALSRTTQLPKAQVCNVLRPILANPAIHKYGQNIKYDLAVLRRFGLELEGLAFDTMVASYCLNPSRATHNLKALALDLLGERMTTIAELIGKGSKQRTMDQVPIERVASYACADAEMVLRLADRLAPLLKEKGLERLFYDVEMPLVKVLADMEQIGIAVDVPYLKELGQQFVEEMAVLQRAIHRLAGQEFNLNSPKQLAFILFEKLRLPVIRRTKTGYSTDEEVLQALSPSHDLPARLMDYRELQKLKSTYIDALLEQVDPATGRVHTSFNQTVTATGRLSSSDPNLQNIPIRSEPGRKTRRAFLPRRGYSLLSADYSQIDLRVLAHVSKDTALCAAFQRGEDIHTATACEIFGVAPQDISPAQRRMAKSINFGLVYGVSAFGLSQQLGIPKEESARYIESYFTRYAGVKAWIERTLVQARQQGYVTTLLGRVRYLPEINSTNGSMRGFAERTAINTPIQGTSADLIKVAMLRLHEAAQRLGWSTRMLVQVHDELVFEVPSAELPEVAPHIQQIMQQALPLDIPVVVDLKAGDNWRDLAPYAGS
ncbi:MAG: DNA polymerase I, partial [Elusimicrobia bacterium]|nr:DNA polymerase I [Elusimicrobiota bacterium]